MVKHDWATVAQRVNVPHEHLQEIKRYRNVICSDDCTNCVVMESSICSGCLRWPDYVCSLCPCHGIGGNLE